MKLFRTNRIIVIRFQKNKQHLILSYYNDYGNVGWVMGKLKSTGKVIFNKTFEFKTEDLIQQDKVRQSSQDEEEIEYEFIIGELVGEFYNLKKNVFGLSNDIFFHKSVKWFSPQ